MEIYTRPKNRRWADARRVIAHDALPVWRNRAVGSITRRDVMQLIDRVVERSPASARPLCGSGGCSPGVSSDLIERSPLRDTRGPAPIKARDRWLNNDEVRLLWRALELTDGSFAPLFKLLLLTGQRREEVTGMRWRF